MEACVECMCINRKEFSRYQFIIKIGKLPHGDLTYLDNIILNEFI